MLIKNVLVLGVLIITYYIALLAISFTYDVIDNDIAILGTVSDGMPDEAEFLLNFLLYFFFPLAIAVAFIVKTRPQQQYAYYTGGFE